MNTAHKTAISQFKKKYSNQPIEWIIPHRREKVKKLRSYVTNQERRELIKTIGATAYILMQYYYECGGRNNIGITDERTSNALGMPVRTIQKYRLALTKNGWFRQTKEGNITITHIGKEPVAFSYDNRLRDLPDEELETFMHICHDYWFKDYDGPSRPMTPYDLLPWIGEIL